MTTSLILQYIIISLMALASVWVVLKKQFPGTLRRLQGGLAQWLIKRQRFAKIQALGRRLAPPVQLGTSCDSCHNCSPGRDRQH